MKIDYSNLNEPFINKCTSNCTIKSDFEIFFQNQCAIEAVKYPFLSKSQIKNRTMTIMKKKNISLQRFKGYQDYAIKKISKLEPPVSKKCKNMKENQNFKDTSAKFPSKKSLVPLKVDFVSNSSNGVPERKSSETGEKRRVSFNKELYIRYRTTSEESSNSTFKDKKNQLKQNYNQYWTQKDDKFDKLINKKCSWSYRSPKNSQKYISMEMTKETTIHVPKTLLDEVPNNKLEQVINNEQLEECKDDYLCTPGESYLEKNTLCKLQKDVQNESVDLSKGDTYMEANNEILNEKSVDKNVKDTMEEMLKKAQLESSSKSKKVLNEKNNRDILNDSVVSGDSSSDEEILILQTRFPVKDGEYNSPKSSPFASISDNESNLEDDLEIKRPLVIQATAYDEKIPVDCKTNHLNSETNNQPEKTDHQEAATERANYSALSADIDNSNIETESSYMQNSSVTKNTALSSNETKGENQILPEAIVKIAKYEKTLDHNSHQRNDILSSDIIIKNFLNGSFDISIFKPERNSTMIDNKIVTKQKHLMEDEQSPNKKKKYKVNIHKNTNNKEVHSMLDNNGEAKHKKINKKPTTDSTDDSMIQLKRKIYEKTENFKKAKVITGKNNDKVTDIISDKLTLKTSSKLESKYSKTSNQFKRVNNRSQYNDKDMIILNNFDMREENNKKNKTKNNMARTKPQKNGEIYKNFSNIVIPLKKSRNLRNSSLVASKKIKEIEKLENDYSAEEILLDSDCSYFDSNAKNIEDNFKSIFKDQKPVPKHKAEKTLEKDKFYNKDITLLEDFQPCSENRGKKENKRTSRSDSKFENIFDECYKTAKCQLKMDKMASEENFISDPYQIDFLVEENRNTNEIKQNSKKRISNRQQSKNNRRAENKLLEYGKNIAKTISKKDTKSIMNCGITTRSKKKTWEMLQNELLGESNDAPYLNSATKAMPFSSQSINKQSIRNKYDEKYKIKDTESKYLQTPANNIQSNEMVEYKSKSIVEKTVASMEKCTADFIAPKDSFFQREWTHSEPESDDMTDKISIDQEAEFHSNMAYVTKENDKYYMNKIVAIVKQSSSIKSETPRRSATKTTYSGEEYKYDFSDAEHLIKKSIITESYSVEDNSVENLKNKSQTLIPSSNKKESDPWTRLIKELNIEQCKIENKSRAISSGKQSKKLLIYNENLKPHTNAHKNKDGEMQFKVNSNEKEFHEQDETEKKNEQDLKQLAFEETLEELNNIDTCNELNVEDNCITNDAESERNNKNAEIGSVSIVGKLRKTTRKMEAKERQAPQMKKVQTSPKFKLQVEDGGVKFKRCNRSSSSSSDESEKQRSIKHDKKLPKVHQKLGRQKYKKYLNNLFDKEKSKDNKMESMREKINSKKYPVNNKNKEQGKMINTLIAKDDNDLFSISSSDSEPVTKGTGLLCDLFDE